MLNETVLLKVLLPQSQRLQEQCSIKELWFLFGTLLLLFLTHK